MFDYIILGQGLAGSAVALQLMKRNRKFVLIDAYAKNHTSNIAAGLFNPITGKKMVSTWLASKLFPYLHAFYKEAENFTQSAFFNPMPLYRPFLSIEEQNEWMGKSTEPAYSPFIEQVFLNKKYQGVHDAVGGLLLKQCGYLDTTSYVLAVRAKALACQNVVIEQEVNEDQFAFHQDTVTFDQQYQARHLIVCQGTHKNDWFKWLPIRPLKGETLRIKTAFQENLVINRGVYIVPAKQSSEWRVGSTYNFHDQTDGVTTSARMELEEKLKAIFAMPYKIVGQEWGVRPTTPDRRPLLGSHPVHKSLWVFNGFGTKGVSLSPFFSEVLITAIENNNRIDKEVAIERYNSLY